MNSCKISEIIKFMNKNKHKTIFSALGIIIESYDPDNVTVMINVDERHLQYSGLVHGGIFVTLAESAASISATLKLGFDYNIVGIEINANHLKQVRSGTLRGKAKLIHHGKSTMVYSINISNSDNKLVCISRCTIAIINNKMKIN